MLVNKFLENSASRLPQKTAVVFQNRRITYGEIDEKANRMANAFLESGLKRGDRVSIFLDNSIESIISIFGVLKAGGVFSTLSPSLKHKKLEYILNHSDSVFLF